MKLPGRTFFFTALLLAGTAGARADITLSLGYYDLAPCCGNSNALPNPWYGSPNTTFLGDAALATSSDPDESGLLFTNTGSTKVTLGPGVTVGSLTLWNSLIGASGFSIAPGASVILSATTDDNFDGSDIPLVDSTISFSLNGAPFSVVDTGHTGAVDGSILAGSTNGSANETLPWTQVGDFLGSTSTPTGVPEPASLAPVGVGLLGLMLGVSRKRQ